MDIHTLIAQAEAHVEAGRLDDAHRLYAILLQALPRDIDLMLAVARVYALIGRPRAAKHLLLRALTLDPLNLRALTALAGHFLRVERNRDAAKELLDQVVGLDAGHLPAWLDLGHVHAAEGRLDEARRCYGRALDLDMRSVRSLSPVFNAPALQGEIGDRLTRDLSRIAQPSVIGLEIMLILNGPVIDVDAAHPLIAQLAAAQGDTDSLLETLTEVAKGLGRLALASACAEVLAGRRPDDPNALGLLADILTRRERFIEARVAWRRLLLLDPSRTDAMINGWVAEIGCAGKEAATLAPQIIAAIRTDYPHPSKAFSILAGAAQNLRQPQLVEALLKATLEEDPDDLDVMHQLAGFYYAEHRSSEAIAAFESILEKQPDRADVYANLLNLSGRARCPDKAAYWIDKVVALEDPGAATLSAYNIAKSLCLWDEAGILRSRILEGFRSGRFMGTALTGTCFNMLGDAAVDNETLFAMHLSVAEGFRRQLKHPPYTQHPAKERIAGKMRIGYVSGDFATHVVNGFFSGLINHCDRSRFEVYCYSTRPEESEDHVSRQYRLAVDRFVNVAGVDDEALARRIHDDGIHVLVDLAGYTAYGRISVFTYTPAPVQMTYLGYSYSSGVAEVDYIIADPFLDGPRTGYYCAEKPLRLAECFMNFGEVKPYPLSQDIPYDRNGFVTFGTMNKSQKMNPEVIRLWSRVLAAVPDSRMVMKRFDYALERTRERIWQEFERNGIERERVRIVWQDETPNYLDFYTTLDLALDPFPFTGATTTMETLRMGVPLVTLVGDAIAQRNSYAVMNNAGVDLTELYAFSEDEFVDKAVSLAMNPERIRHLHRTMPAAIHTSPLVRPERFARQMEAAFVEGWNRKFPQRRWGERADERQCEWVKLLEGTEIAVANTTSDLFGYVLKEQERWFDADWLFAVGFAPGLTSAWEVSADPGVYALPMARQGVPKCRVWSVSEVMLGLLRQGMARNGLADLQVDHANRFELDLPWQDPPDWLRLGAEAGLPAGQFVQANRAGLAAANPVLLLPVTARDRASLVADLAALGYAPYTFVPGINALAPFTSGHWDTFTRNLFFLRERRAKVLAAQGLLVLERVGLDSEPTAEANYWLDHLAGLPYAADRLDRWQEVGMDAGSRHQFLALNLYALSRYEAAPLDLRLACLERAAEYAPIAVSERQSLPRLLTAARIFAEAGRRAKAVQCLNQLVAQVTGSAAMDLDEPFLALEPAWEGTRPDDPAGWLFAMILATGDKWRAHSSRFTGLASLPVLDRVIATGWVPPEVTRRTEMIRRRFHLEAGAEADALPV
jgi:tetratricopeptide (TPR) repeat protein